MSTNGPYDAPAPPGPTGAITDTGVVETVRDGYDAVYDALPRSDMFNRIWRANAYRGELPAELAHISFLTLDASKVAGMPVLGVNPVADHASVLEAAGLTVETYEETPGWAERAPAAFDATDVLATEVGERAAAALLAEATLTVELKPLPATHPSRRHQLKRGNR